MKNKNNIIIFSVVFLLLGAFIGLIVWGQVTKNDSARKFENMTSREVALQQTTDMATEYHIHPELTVLVNGKEVPVPENLGVTATGMTALHTHNEKGIIHVEAPVIMDFTLGDFFAVWGKDFSRTKLLDNVVTDASEVVITVNGQKVDTYENTILRDKDTIVVSYQDK